MNTEAKKRKKDVFNRVPLKKKLVLAYLLLTMIPILVIGIFVMQIFSRSLKEKLSYSAEQGFSQTYDFLAYRFSKTSDTLNQFANSDMIQRILLKDLNDYGIVEQMSDMLDMRKAFEDARNGEDVDRVRIYVRDELMYSIDQIHLFGLNSIESTVWYRYLQEDADQILGCPYSWLAEHEKTEKEILSLARTVKSPNDYRKVIGYLRVDMDKGQIDDILNKANAAKDAETYICNGNGEIVAGTGKGKIPKEAWETARTAGFQKAYMEGNAVLYRTQDFENLDWTMMTVIPYSSFMREITALKNRFLVCMTLFSALVSVCIYLIGKSITDRVGLLAEHMKRVQSGELTGLEPDESTDEIGVLYDNFNYMIEETKALLEEKYRLGKEVKNAELKALQSQINPHFLYNTLDMIKWMCYAGRTADIERAVASMAKFYKITLSRGRNIVTVRDELEHSREYVNIQNMRFGDRITLKVAVPEELMDVPIPKITLQPLIENAILHGILETEDETGTVTISGAVEKDSMIITVTDDGVGMEEDQISRLFSASEAGGSGSSYGIRNIRQRIRLLYGSDSDLLFTSRPGEGTEVKILLKQGKNNTMQP